jgi:hypothetical protein
MDSKRHADALQCDRFRSVRIRRYQRDPLQNRLPGTHQ